MKNRFWSLYQTQLNVYYGWSAGKYLFLKKRKRIWEPLLLIVILVPVAVLLMGLIWSFTEQMFLAGSSLGQPQLALVLGSLLASVLSLVFGFFYVLSAFFFSNDLAILTPLPVQPREILLAKLAVVLTGQYLINALFLVPLWVRYGLLAQAGLSYAICSLVVFILLPITPLVLASLVSVLLMRLVNLSRHKDKLTLAGGIIILILSVSFQFFVRSVTADDPEQLMAQLLSRADGLVNAVGRVFPPSVWAAQAQAYSHLGRGWLHLFYVAAVSAMGLAILYILGQRVFLRGLLGGLEGSKGSGRASRRQLSFRGRSLFSSLVGLERKLFLRDPMISLNGLASYVFVPLLAVLPLFSRTIQDNPFSLVDLTELPPLLLVGVIALFFALMTALSSIPATTFSREGKYLWTMRVLPVPIEVVIGAKVASSQLINTSGCLLGLLPVAYLYRWNALAVLGGVVLGVLLASILAFLLALLDLWRPLLDWVNPVKAVKSNLNALVGMLGAGLLVFGLGMLLAANLRAQSLGLALLEVGLVLLSLGGLAAYLVKRFAPRLWLRIGGG